MLLYFVFIIFLIILLLNIYVLDLLIKKKENFINDYYNKYIETITVPSDFYNMSAILPNHHYAAEFNDRFFIDTLNKNKIISSIAYNKNQNLKDKKMIESILIRANNYLVNILNKEMPLDEKFLFSNIYSENVLAKIIINGVFIIKSKHIIYRETKIYGISLSITTIHSLLDNSIHLLDFELYGFIFEDKVNAFEPSNLIDNDYQDYKKDNIHIKDPNYENQFLCQYFDNLYKFRGIKAPNITHLNCPIKI
jgi:hypothetical protein